MLFELLMRGGVVVWTILGMGLLAFGVFIERALHLHRARIRSEDFLKGIYNILARKNISEAVAICEETPGPVAHIAKTAILHRDYEPADLRTAVDDAGVSEISRMERRLVVVASVAQLAPLMGLLGTVLGMVELMMVLQNQVIVQSADIMGGMLKALIATGAGLCVAIPCHAAFNLLIVKIDRIVLDMEKAASEIVAFIKGGMKADEQ
jgi:biopolymer transport protein ExbB